MAEILVVDDEPLICELLEKTLGAEGHRVKTAGNGLDALRLAVDFSPAVLITDVFMPEMEGMETIKKFREQLPALKIIVISGGSPIRDMDVLQWAEALGAAHTFQKPIDRRELVEAVNACLGAPS